MRLRYWHCAINVLIKRKISKLMDFITINNSIILPYINNENGVYDENMKFIEQSKHDGGWLKIGGSYEMRGAITDTK